MAISKITDNSLNITDLTIADDLTVTDDLLLASDSAVIKFGADADVTITHDPDDGLVFKSTATADDNPFLLTLQTGETDLAADDVIGKIAFQAPDEGTGTDAILVSAAIQARAEGNHSSSSNATSIDFMVGASEAAATKMTLTSAGKLEVSGGVDIEGGAVFNEDSADVDFRVESNGNANMVFVDGGNDVVGIGTVPATTGNIVTHIKQGDSGAAAGDGYHAYNNLIVETNAGEDGGGISIHGDASSLLQIAFGDPADSNVGVIYYLNGSDEMHFLVGATDQFSINQYGAFAQNGNNSGGLVYEMNNANGTNPYGMRINFTGADADNNTTYFLAGEASSNNKFKIFSDGDMANHDNSFGSLSDERIKQDITDANSQWNDIKAVKVRNFKKKDDVEKYGDKAWSQIGVIAQELETVSPKLIKETPPEPSDIKHSSEFGTLYTKDDAETQNAVLYTSDDSAVKNEDKKVGDIKTPSTKQIGDVKEVKDNVKKVSYSILYMKAVKALQEAMERIETLEAKVKALEDA